MNKIVEIEVAMVNAAADILADVNASAAARAVRELAHNYKLATEQRSAFREMLAAIINSPTPELMRKARKLVEEA